VKFDILDEPRILKFVVFSFEENEALLIRSILILVHNLKNVSRFEKNHNFTELIKVC